jgi:hypothetical protein
LRSISWVIGTLAGRLFIAIALFLRLRALLIARSGIR